MDKQVSGLISITSVVYKSDHTVPSIVIFCVLTMTDVGPLLVLLLLPLSLLSSVLASGIRKNIDGDLKLLDGDNFAAGTVAVYRGYTWGRVCDDNWSIREANVACRQLGLGFAVRALKRNHFHSVTGRKLNY